ncbi:MAG: hypothetical protein IJB86_01005 [Clostridia bacterium]|nr:hypothetical protein [Clostridia bacterium]
MNKALKDCLENRQNRDNIFPFLWMREEAKEELKEEIDALYDDGCREFCCESRPYEHFCGDRWWDDFGYILEYAKQKGMRVWLLDDKHFPTGYANGYVEANPELRPKTLRYEYRDFCGPCEYSSLLVPELEEEDEEKVICVSAWKKGNGFFSLKGKPIDLTDKVHDGIVDWAVPEGFYRVYYIIESKRSLKNRKGYIDMLSEESCNAMLKAVYEPHYEHFKEYFGNTFRGFFSDEPSFQNASGSYLHMVGSDGIVMPYRSDLPSIIGETLGMSSREVLLYLGTLWHDFPGMGKAVRCEYMEAVTRLYRDNFSRMLGDWCRERNVLYIGHVIEDMDAHQRLGFGGGHFFRALQGQDMSGIDIVLKQLMPYNLDTPHSAPICGHRADPAFFQHTLPKLGASGAHIRPETNNKAMCEVFGAFGWAEGVGYMKYIADLMLSSGINQFVPHAYSIPYPDPSCPPYFHSKGMNPQEKAFGLLIEYMQKTAHILSQGIHKADVAVFYNAQAEWTGGKHNTQSNVCQALRFGHIDFDIVPEDVLKVSEVNNGRLCINKETYGALVVPYSEILPDDIQEMLLSIERKGLAVIYENRLPKKSVTGKAFDSISKSVPTELLAQYLRDIGCCHVLADDNCRGLRIYRTDTEDGTVYSIFNEDKTTVDSYVYFENVVTPVFYDVWNNEISKPQKQDGRVRIKLYPGQAVIMLCNESDDVPPFCYDSECDRQIVPVWDISLKAADAEDFTFCTKTEKPIRFNTYDRESYFCGTIRYTAEVKLNGDEEYIDFGTVGEIAHLYINGKDIGTTVAPPYRFRISDAVKHGINEIRLDVINNPTYRERYVDWFSSYTPLPPSGLLGPVKIK